MYNNLNIEKDVSGDVTVIRLSGEFDFESEEIFEQFTNELGSEELYKVLLNMKGLEWMNSRSIRALIRLYTQVRKAGGKLILTDICPRVGRILYLTKLSSLLDKETTEKRGIEQLNSISAHA